MDRVDPNWHRDFFEGLWLQVQGRSFDEEQNLEMADAVVDLLQVMPGAKLLDVPCGEGRIAVELAARGFSVTGIDRSSALLDQARSRAAERGETVDWVEGDMWALDLPAGRFDGALCLWASLGYGTEAQDEAFLRALYAGLKPGAGLVLEVHVTETLLPNFEERGWRRAGEVVVAEERAWDAASGRVMADWVLSGPAGQESRRSSVRIYSYRELTALLGSTGFGDFEAFGSPELEPFELGSSRLLLLARRAEAAERA